MVPLKFIFICVYLKVKCVIPVPNRTAVALVFADSKCHVNDHWSHKR